MPFTVAASNSMGVVTFPRDSLSEAVNKGVELLNSGYPSVEIRDPTGNLIDDSELRDRFNEEN